MKSQSAKESTLETFKRITEAFSACLGSEGINVEPYVGCEPVHFAGLKAIEQSIALTNFNRYFQIAEEVISSGNHISNDRVFLWRMLTHLKLKPPADLFDHLKDGDIIEIHNKEIHQVFRNVRFFEICGYTLDDLLARPFWELIQRDKDITERLLEMARSVLFGEVNGVLTLNIPPHEILELSSPAKKASKIQQTIAAPLKDSSGNVQAIVTTFKVLSSRNTAQTANALT